MNVGAITASTPFWMTLNPPKHRVQSEQADNPMAQSAPTTPMIGSSIQGPPVEATLTASERLPTLRLGEPSGIQPMSDSGAAKNVENATAFGYRLQKLCSMAYASATPTRGDATAE